MGSGSISMTTTMRATLCCSPSEDHHHHYRKSPAAAAAAASSSPKVKVNGGHGLLSSSSSSSAAAATSSPSSSASPTSSSSSAAAAAAATTTTSAASSSLLPYLSISSVLSQKAAAVLSVASETSYALSGAVLSAIAGVTQIAIVPGVVEDQEQHHHHHHGGGGVDTLKQGRLVERVVYRQTFVVRSYEVGPDKTATLDTFLNLFQETALNHVLISGLAGNGFGTTHEMIRNNLIWVVTRMQVQVERYPAWGNALEIDTWVGASGKNGMRRDWLVRDYKTGSILARATSTWVMMHKDTRRLSKMPDLVRAEISPWFLSRTAFIPEESCSKIEKLDNSNTRYIRSNLTPRHSDLDMNQHVNNVKYLTWMMESLPQNILESHHLVGITLEYRRECSKSDMVESLTHPERGGHLAINGAAAAAAAAAAAPPSQLDFIHLLRMQTGGSEIVRARTSWKSRH
ncbi:palmitoyl-acyl carrier protein thioesterase, chloroplastic [Selaginella moellendorffii]|nr:palmitoyl-acyl carrier protein thioesterase, chloroplastic [Selaginella moellendorffii]|eukprot:XP_002962077.2 palmitoyl-acyl carrier protein thioesterase, chloroplastic [Selaginella moellendorffii]